MSSMASIKACLIQILHTYNRFDWDNLPHIVVVFFPLLRPVGVARAFFGCFDWDIFDAPARTIQPSAPLLLRRIVSKHQISRAFSMMPFFRWLQWLNMGFIFPVFPGNTYRANKGHQVTRVGHVGPLKICPRILVWVSPLWRGSPRVQLYN